jgi:hypothetical protein
MFKSNSRLQHCMTGVAGMFLAAMPLAAAEFWVVQVSFDANGTEIQQIKRLEIADGQRRNSTSPLSQGGEVLVSLTSANGEVLHQLSIDDPRIIRVPMLPGKAQGHQFVVRDAGEFTLILPATAGASSLDLQWAESPSQPMLKNRQLQQLSLQAFADELQIK